MIKNKLNEINKYYTSVPYSFFWKLLLCRFKNAKSKGWKLLVQNINIVITCLAEFLEAN